MKRLLIFGMGAGFAAGAGSAATYLLLGGKYFGAVPRWAEILFFPGFLAGNWVFEQTLEETPAKVVGVLAVGFAFALLGGVVLWIWRRARRPGVSP